jgi:hypothetical protein
MTDHLYHYTDEASIKKIIGAGRIRPAAMTVYRDVYMRDKGLLLDPVIWLTINPILDGTIFIKMRGVDKGFDPVGKLHRIVLPRKLTDEGLGEYVDRKKLDPDWFTLLVETGVLAGSNYTTWRLIERAIPATQWIAVEVLSSLVDGMTAWTPVKGATV